MKLRPAGQEWKGQLGGLLRLSKASHKQKTDWFLILYYSVLVLVTDCFIWFTAGSLAGYDWQYLVVYSLLSYPLWMIIVVKGAAKEQVDLIETSRWHSADLLPCGPTLLFIGHYIGKTMKQRSLHAWLLIYLTLVIVTGSELLLILLALVNLVVGAINLVVASILTKYYAPRGYSSVIQSIFYNVTWIFSGAVFPMGMISQSPWFYLLNPFSAAVSAPLMLLEGRGFDHTFPILLFQSLGSLAWFAILLLITLRAERVRRDKFY